MVSLIDERDSMKYAEFFGVVCGIVGAFLAAAKFGNFGYPLFTLSSIALLYSAIKQKNWNLTALQGTFFCANIVGVYNFVFG